MAKKITLEEIGESLVRIEGKMATREELDFVIKHMVTKEDLKDEIDPIKATLAEHTEILDDHTKRLNRIEGDVKSNLDKRLQLEVRVKNVEEKVGL